MLMAGICLCIIITAGGATAIDTAGKLRPSQASVSPANQLWRNRQARLSAFRRGNSYKRCGADAEQAGAYADDSRL
jgi:hypothetical protein